MHGGEVRATSEGSGKGATFAVRLPLARAVERRRRPEPQEDSAALPNVDFSDHLLLIVDDDEATRDLLETMLSGAGARVKTVINVATALAELDVEVPAVVIGDIGMPGEDGLSMIRRVRQRSPGRGGLVPAIALSAYARPEDREAALASGYDEFLTKPAMPVDVLRAVARVLTTRREPLRRERRRAPRAAQTPMPATQRP
jgi:CheY-like chemotaxis protein